MKRIDLNKIQSFVFVRQHLVTGHRFYEEFNAYQGVTPEVLGTGVPTPAVSRRLDVFIAEWNRQNPETWGFCRISLGEAVAHQAELDELESAGVPTGSNNKPHPEVIYDPYGKVPATSPVVNHDYP